MSALHYANLRLRNNAGMDMPECRAHADLLDLDCGRWPTTPELGRVTCGHCVAALNKYRPWPLSVTDAPAADVIAAARKVTP